VKGDLLLDLAYAEDSIADADVNVVATSEGELIEVQEPPRASVFARRLRPRPALALDGSPSSSPPSARRFADGTPGILRGI